MYPLWYSEEERRRRWPVAAATHGLPRGWAEPRRRAASLDCARDAVLSGVERTALLVARVLLFEYATLLAPGAAGRSAQRGRGDV